MIWRRHQREALEAVDASDDASHWVVLPPGAGKTMLGVEAAARWGRPTVAFGPNNAIVGQWCAAWETLTGSPAGTTRDLEGPFTALTYQSLAVFDPTTEAVGAHARLHPNGVALVERLRSLGPVTVILDECHHLLQVWGELLDEVIALLDDAVVLALTATPPEMLTAAEAERVERLFGEITYHAGIPDLVVEGDLAPFAELAWFTSPTAREDEWLDARAVRSAELITELTAPLEFGIPLVTWATVRPFAELDPGDADATIRLALAGHLPMPDGAQLAERHRHAPDLQDWLTVAQGWLLALRATGGDRREVADRVAALLPGVGYRLTRHGIRPGQPLVDRVLARSASKAGAAVEIVAATLADDPDARLLILTDHATAAALPADLDGVLSPESGSARWVLAALLADDRTRAADPLLVTGAMLAGGEETARRLGPSRDDGDGVWVVEEGSPGGWARTASAALAAGDARVVVGTRGLLGEGWDARTVTGVIDLTTATTTTAIVQTRGRSLRHDPARPDKVAVNWTVTCVAAGRSQGDADYQRLVRKHAGWFAVDGEGDVVDGVAHLDARLGPDSCPPATDLAALNRRALDRAADPDSIRAAWRAIDPQRAQPAATLRIRGTRLPAAVDSPSRLPTPTATAGLPVGLLLAAAGGAQFWPPLWLVFLVLLGASGAAWVAVESRRRREAHAEPSLSDYGRAVADALHDAGTSPVGSEAVVTETTADGEVRIRLRDAPEPATQAFTDALAELVGPITQPRYLVSRPVWDAAGDSLRDAFVDRTPEREVWHVLPSVFAGSRASADLFLERWRALVGDARAVYSSTPEGAGLVRALRWSSPLGEDAGLSLVVRRHW